MTYPSRNFYPAIEAHRSSAGLGADSVQAFEVASRKAAAAVERTRRAAGSLVQTYAYWRSVHETTRQLSCLDDTALRDIGLHRGQIPYVARCLALKKHPATTPRAQYRAG
ncbi:MAG: DUF1127 domain-containing protein [Kiloniellaceae bacterium]